MSPSYVFPFAVKQHKNLNKPMAAIQASSPEASLCFSASPTLLATHRSDGVNNTNTHHVLKLENKQTNKKGTFEMHTIHLCLKRLTRSFSCWVLMGKSEERVSSEESSALASRSHAQQQVTTTKRVRALTMVLEGCDCSGWGLWKCPSVPSGFIGSKKHHWHQFVCKIFMAISWHGWHRSAPLHLRLNDDVMNG